MSQKTLKRGRWSVQQWETCARGREVTAKGLRLLWPYETDAPFVFSWLSCRNTTFLGDWCHFVLLILQIMCECAVSTFFLSIMPSEARLGCTQEEIGRGEVGMQSPLTVFFFFSMYTLFCCHWITAVDDVILKMCMDVFLCEEFDTAICTVYHGLLFFFLFVHKDINQTTKRMIFQGFPGTLLQWKWRELNNLKIKLIAIHLL